jgi:hypothetical protein
VTIRIARGTGRIALVGRRWTVKIPYPRRTGHPYRGRMWAFAWGLLANISEHEHSRAAGVNPVRWSLLGGLANIYRTARPLTCDPARWPDTSPDVATDRHYSNVGWVDGQLRWVDYDSSGEDVLGFRRALDDRSG